ncbi:MAG: RHS repeat-associated core domain-containing protein [Acidobacteria bacterium]|nr:RHS repeat-associated core domain-containing protein [Acidobacteriota bacterium]
MSFVFNGENKQSQVLGQNNHPIGRYFYDGEGRRVKKVTDLETTVFVYDASSKLIAEYSNQTPQNPNTSYVGTGTLLSVRLVTDKSGNVVSRRDFKPFGEDLAADQTFRKKTDKYSTATQDKVRQRFTGYLKDIETGLDFAEARMYENRHGRFTAVDPLLVSGTTLNPQSFNRFLYVQNDPINLIDPSGLACENADRRGDERCIWVAKGNSYGSMWESRFKGGNDLFDAGFTIVENPEAVDPFFLEAVHDTDEGPLNSVDEEYQTMIGMKVVLGINGRFEVRDAKALRDEDGMFGFLGATQDSFRDRLLYGSCNEGQGSCGEQLFNQDLLPDSVELNGGFLGASLGTKLTRNGTWFGQGGGDFIGSVANPLTLVKIAQNGRITPSISLMFNKTLRFGRMSPETRNNVESGFTVGIGGGSGLGGQVLYVPSTGDVVVGAGLTTPGIWVGGGYAAPFKRRLFSW